MSSQKTEKDNKTPLKYSPFKFGDYVSPNPKPIPIGIKYKPPPLVQYETSTTTETECEPIPSPYKHKSEPKPIETQNINISQTNDLKAKIQSKQEELQFLQSQLKNLQIAKNKSKTTEPENNNKSIVFDPSVQIIDKSKSNTIHLTDKTSSIRSKRDLTPYKPTYKPRLNLTNNGSLKVEYEEDSCSSRSHYRTTPVPRKPKKRLYTSELQTITDDMQLKNNENDKENVGLGIGDENAQLMVDNIINATHINKFTTPTNKTNKKSEFQLGVRPASSTQSPNVSGSDLHGIFAPILTPIKGKGNEKPFQFAWNKQKKSSNQ